MADTAGGTTTQSTAGEITYKQMSGKERGEMIGGIAGGVTEGLARGLRRDEPTVTSAMLGDTIIPGVPNGMVFLGSLLILGGVIYASKA